MSTSYGREKYRGFTCVLFKMWQVAAVKFRELFDRCLRHQWNTDCPKPRGLCHGTRAVAVSWAAGLLPARPRAPDRRAGGRAGLPGSCVAWCKRNKARFEAGRTTKYSTRLSVTHTSRTHTDTHTHTLRVAQWAYLLGLGAVACKWSGVA